MYLCLTNLNIRKKERKEIKQTERPFVDMTRTHNSAIYVALLLLIVVLPMPLLQYYYNCCSTTDYSSRFTEENLEPIFT